MKYLFTINLIIFCLLDTYSQDKKDFKISGGFSAGGELYDVSGIPERRSPYSYNVNGYVVFSYKDFSLPVSASYRDAQFSYDYTFNRFGITPTYKWIKLHLGWSNLNFSPYTYSGRPFYGIGIELTPGIFYFGAMAGKIRNPLAIRDTLVYGSSLVPSYDRKLKGIKVGLRKAKNKLELMAVKIEDDPESFEYPDNYTQTYGYQVLTPKENICIGLNGAITLFKRLDIYANTGVSAFTADRNDSLLITYGSEVPSFIKGIFQANTSSRITLAGDGGANFRFKGHKIGFKYRRVDPFYATLATNYFQNDLEQYTFILGTQFWKRKIRLDGQLGIEHNNLTKLRTNTTDRIIGNLNANINFSESLQTSLQYSNFQTESVNEILQLNDTLRFVSSSNNYGLYTNYLIKKDSRQLTFNLFINYNTVRDQSEFEQIGDVNIFSAGLAHGYTFEENDLSLFPSINYNQYNYRGISQVRYGGGIKINKKFFDKRLSLSLGTNLFTNKYDGLNDGWSSNFALNTVFKVGRKSSLALNNTFRIQNSTVNRSFREVRSVLRYNHRF